MRTMLLGHFGSGKTEVAIAYALKLAGEGRHPLLLDLDIITPYFRSRDPAQRLADLGVEVIAPSPEWSAADLPLISGQTLMHLRAQGDRAAVLDVGGDEGARVIAARSSTSSSGWKPSPGPGSPGWSTTPTSARRPRPSTSSPAWTSSGQRRASSASPWPSPPPGKTWRRRCGRRRSRCCP